MSRLWLFALGLFLLATALTVSALGIGAAQPPPSALIGLDGCGLPCWNQIVPRQTSFDAARAILDKADYNATNWGQTYRFEPADSDSACQVWLKIADSKVNVTSLVECPDVRLGDLLAILGKPDGILRSLSGLVFRDGQILVLVHEFACDEWFTPETNIRMVYFADDEAMHVHNQQTTDPIYQSFDWRGFASRAYYRAHEADFPACD